MNAGAKFAIGAVLIVGSVGYLMASGVKQTGQYFLTPTELTQKIAVDPSFYDVGMKVGARVALRSGSESLDDAARQPGAVARLAGGHLGRPGGVRGRAQGSSRPRPQRPPRRLRDVRRTARRGRLARVGAVPARLQRRVRRRVHQP